ncbi:hypothetical protein PENTCL1PPCAC_3211 [Pristionchus entomophagus]|uniref:Uncharacterized protein n=1 Tax=Pristionchus entomophagus TaxID=358040 RepID=A0AAV5SN51_9BILA|nr:hypothetical protein PENTCL1PPCAC_3211 [Pristionchus entomophagus]
MCPQYLRVLVRLSELFSNEKSRLLLCLQPFRSSIHPTCKPLHCEQRLIHHRNNHQVQIHICLLRSLVWSQCS